MSEAAGRGLDGAQLDALKAALHQGSANASAALKDWIGKASVIEIDSIDQLPLEEATSVLAHGDQPIPQAYLRPGFVLGG